MDTEKTLQLTSQSVLSVPMARGKHLFPCRTQQLSLAAVTILGVHPWENSTVPNYIKPFRIGGALSFLRGPSGPQAFNLRSRAVQGSKTYACFSRGSRYKTE